MKKRWILFAAAMMLVFHVATGCQKTEQDESTQRLPETVTEAVGNPAPAPDVESVPDAEPAPVPELPVEPKGNDSEKKYTLNVTVEGEDF